MRTAQDRRASLDACPGHGGGAVSTPRHHRALGRVPRRLARPRQLLGARRLLRLAAGRSLLEAALRHGPAHLLVCDAGGAARLLWPRLVGVRRLAADEPRRGVVPLLSHSARTRRGEPNAPPPLSPPTGSSRGRSCCSRVCWMSTSRGTCGTRSARSASSRRPRITSTSRATRKPERVNRCVGLGAWNSFCFAGWWLGSRGNQVARLAAGGPDALEPPRTRWIQRDTKYHQMSPYRRTVGQLRPRRRCKRLRAQPPGVQPAQQPQLRLHGHRYRVEYSQ